MKESGEVPAVSTSYPILIVLRSHTVVRWSLKYECQGDAFVERTKTKTATKKKACVSPSWPLLTSFSHSIYSHLV